jgi:TolB-like protein/predicted Ser/Thr protein kinase
MIDGTKLGRYEIRSKIGEGGMGEVYLAQDTKLDRKVALKILPADVASQRDRMERFIREAKSAAALNHPNIAHIYEIGEHDGTHFIAMEYIDGETLREKIHKSRVPLSKLLKYLNQVAEGLGKAHAAGIVHRDLKPENIMITRDDYAKVLDFGLAKLVEPQRSFGSGSGSSEVATALMHQHSTPGMVMGTIGYMSPEQASGRVHEIDHRSDIFSFGCILFEAATGQRAFEGKDALDSLHKIVHAPTPQLKDVNPLAPDELQRIVRRCLAKESEKRYQSIKEVAIELDDLQQDLKAQTASNYSGHAVSSTSAATSASARAEEGFWVAVLPFKTSGTSLEVNTLAEGLADEIVTGLSRFSYLRVIARSSTSRYASETSDVRDVGKELGARYVMEGSLRQAGTTLRVAVQLVDAISGAQLWAETYNRAFSTGQIFELQDELVPRIVSTVADLHGVLPHSMSEVVRRKPPDQLSPYEAVLRSFGYTERVTADELADALACLELAVQKAPNYADALAMLASYYTQDHGQGFDLRTEPLLKGENLARKAVEIAPANHLAWISLAQVHFFQKEFQTFTNAAERAVALNQMDGNSMATLGELLTFSGNWERGPELVERAKQLNPNHPGWYWYVNFHRAYQERDYESALGFALKVNLPSHWVSPAMLAAAYGQLGQREAAAKAVRDMLKLRPEVASTVRVNLEKWWTPEDVEHFIDGLRKAGLKIAAKTEGSEFSLEAVDPATEDKLKLELSTPSIAVLPFTNVSADPENEFFCDGLAEELLNALGKIEELKVAARTSAFSFKGKNVNVSEIGRVLGVNTVLEGSVRKAEERVRITVQLVSIADGYHLWSERYDREMKDIFDVQDEITLAIVDALKVKLLGAKKAAVLKRHTRSPEAHEFYLRGLSYFMRWTPDFFQKAIESFDQAIAIDPRYAPAYAGLAECYTEMSFFGAPREWMPKAKEAARQALELDDTLGNAHNSLAVIKMYYDRDYAGAEHEFKRGIALDPGSAHIHMWYGWYLGLMGRFDEGLKEQRRAQELDPLSDHSNFGIGATFYWSRQPERAIEHFHGVIELNPNFRIAYWFLTDAYVAKGDFASAIATIENAPIALNDPVTLSAAGHAYGKAGERRKALEILSELERQSSQEYELAFHIAQIYLGLGDHEQALAWLEKACDERSIWLIWLGVDPKFDPLRSDPRFQDLLRRVGAAAELR